MLAIDSQSKVQINKANVLPWIICGLGALFYCYQALLRASPAVMTEGLMSSYHINSAVFLGNLSAYYYLIYAPMQLPVGFLLDRYGPRRVLTFAGLCCAMGAYFFASSTHLVVAELGRFLIGFGAAFAFVGLLKMAVVLLPKIKFGFLVGLIAAIGMIGGLLGDLSLNELVRIEGWRLTSYFAACFGLVLTLMMFLVLRDSVGRNKTKQVELSWPSAEKILFGAWKIMKRQNIWLLGIIGSLLYLPMIGFAELWGIPYLQQSYYLKENQAAEVISLLFIGWVIGAPIMGWLSDYLKQRRLLLTIGAVCSAILVSIIFYVPAISIFFVSIILFLLGLFCSAQVIVYVSSRELVSAQLAGFAIAFTNMLVMFSGLLFQPLIGNLLEHFWSGYIVNGMHVYTVHDYQAALLVLPISLVITVFLTFLLQDTYSDKSG